MGRWSGRQIEYMTTGTAVLVSGKARRRVERLRVQADAVVEYVSALKGRKLTDAEIQDCKWYVSGINTCDGFEQLMGVQIDFAVLEAAMQQARG